MRPAANINRFFDAFTATRRSPWTMRLFRKAIYTWYLVHLLILLPAAPAFWGRDSFVPVPDRDYIDANPLLNILCYDRYADLYPYFLGVLVVLLVLGILCIAPRIVSILIYFFGINLDNKAYVILDGGNNLVHLMLIYLVFMNPAKPSPQPKNMALRYLDNGFSNAALLMAQLQVVMVYLVSGLGKVTGTLWQNGTALYYTLNVDEYTHPVAKDLVSHYPLLTVLGTYVTLLYQVAFPWVVWNKRVRPYLLAFGTFIHLQISFVMGLFMFGFAIAVAYISFTPDKAAEKTLNVIARSPSWLLRRLKGWATTRRWTVPPGNSGEVSADRI